MCRHLSLRSRLISRASRPPGLRPAATGLRSLPLVLGAALLLMSPSDARAATTPDWPIVSRQGDRLFEGDQPFRTFGLATPNLQQHEGQLLPDASNRFPDEFETRDALASLHQLGARATRCFALSVASPADRGLPAYITARRTYNEEAFRALDRVLALCPDYDVRLMLPFIASQSFAGIRGVDEFAALSGKTAVGAFWTDPEVKADFKHLLAFIVNRRNTISGRLYRDDPAILGWQLGNEFASYAPDRKLSAAEWTPRITAWSLEMAAYLKQLDPHHLVFEAGGDRAAYLASPDIDVISTHLYEYWNRLFGGPTDLAAAARADWAQCRGRKPLIVDEFGLATVDNCRALMRTIRESDIVGGFLWSLRVHRRDGGFYYHNEGGTPINSYHFPGFATGHDYDETQLLDLLRAESFAIRGMTPAPLSPPSPAPLLRRTAAGFTWRGSTGAAFYTIERAPSPEGPWTVAATGLADSVVNDVKKFEADSDGRPLTLWTDEALPPGGRACYRIRGFNAAGASPWSPVLGPSAD